MGNNAVKVGVNERDLEQRGVEVEGRSFLPELPDCLGYVLGMLLLWLVYTGYRSATQVMEKPIAVISEQAETIKETVKEFTAAEPPVNADGAAAAAGAPAAAQESRSGWEYRLEKFNGLINQASTYVAQTLNRWFGSESGGSADREGIVGSSNPAHKKNTRQKSDDLVWF